MQNKDKHIYLLKAYRSRSVHSLGVVALALLGLMATPSSMAQNYTLTTLASFNGTNGSGPQGSLTLSGKTLYGTTRYGGVYGHGTVFSVPATGGTPIVLASFNGANGGEPVAGLTLSGSTLYGTTYKPSWIDPPNWMKMGYKPLKTAAVEIDFFLGA